MKGRIRIGLFILTSILVISSLVYATPVNIETAKQVANNWYLERSEENNLKNVEVIETFFIRENSQDIYYVFNFREGGYIMIAADDAVVPVLGYSFEHHYGLENHPPQFDAMLASFKEQIVYAKENNLSASQAAQDEWERLNVRTENFERNRDFNRLGPLISSLWNQSYSWNTYCPPDVSGPGGYVYAGCTAVAMAQVMNYWGQPTTGTGSHSYSCPPYGTLSANFGSTTYNFPMNNSSPTNASRELLYHCGVGAEMDYGPDASGAWVGNHTYCARNALVNYFKYNSIAHFELKNDYSDTVWKGMIKTDLDNGRPLVYRGYYPYYPYAGHAFNLDGYEDLDIIHFHFNWGWSGSYNGYYYLNNLNPGSHNFTDYQGAIFSLCPTINVWTGNHSHLWGNTANWSLGHIPSATEDVEIPNVNMPCIVDYSDKTCNNLTIYPDATVNIYDQTLTVNNDLINHGTIGMLQDNSYLNIMHDVVWESGSSLNVTAYSSYINVYGDWNFENGANVNPTQGFVDFEGTTGSWIRCYSTNSNFYMLRNYKSGGAKAIFSNVSTEDIVINGLVYTSSGSILESMSNQNIIMRGDFNYYGTFDFTQLSNTGSVIFDGTSQNINNYSSGSGTFNNVVFSASTGVTLVNEGITVAGDLTIEQGNFNSANYPVTVGGNWINSGGSYTPGTSMVTFDSSGDHQDVNGTNTFYDVHQINNSMNLRFNGNNTILNDLDLDYFCWAYHTFNVNGTLNIDDPSSRFTANGASAIATIATLDQGGTVYCNGAATITINDLVESTIQGTYYADDVGGVINLSNGGSAVDLAGDLYINGGTMNISGTFCFWPYYAAASITMTDGVLDVTSCGIYLSASNTLTETITGGTIRTSGGFTGLRTDFNPTGGTLELYGTTDASLSLGTGSNLYNVNINKLVADNLVTKSMKSSKREKVRIDRDGAPFEVTRSQTINVTSDLDITGDLQISNGTFNLNGFNVNVLNDVKNYGSLTVAVTDTLNTGNDMYLYSGSVVDLSGTILLGTRTMYYGDAIHNTGSTFNQTSGDYYVETINLYDGSQFNGTGGITHMYVNGSSSTNNIEIDDPDSYFYKFYVDDGANAALVGCIYDLDVSNASYIRGALDINSCEMNVQYFDVYDNGNLIIDDGGVVNVNGNGPYMHSTGALTMTTGSELNSASNISFQSGSIENVSGGDIYLEGSLTNSSGIFTPTDGSVTFDGSTASLIDGTTAFHDLNINKTGSTVTTNAAFSMNDLVINSGILNPSGFDIEVYGDWTNNVGDAGFVEGTGTVTFDGTGDVSITPAETFYNLTLDKVSSADWLTPNGDLTIGNDLVINPGALYSGNNTISVNGNATVNSGGVLYMQANSTLALDDASNLNVNSGGWLYVVGSSGNQATVTHQSTGFYGFNINSGGTIGAQYATFEYMDGNGIYLLPGANVHSTFTFNNCIFRNGHDAPSALLSLNNDSEFTSTGASFYNNASGLTGYNVWKYYDTGEATFNDVTGDFWGAGDEYDPYNRVHWSGGVLLAIDDLTIQYNAGTNTIVLTWTYPVPVDQFKVYRSTDPYDFIGSTVFTTATVGYSEPATGTKYFYRVTAENISDNIGTGGKAASSDSAPWNK